MKHGLPAVSRPFVLAAALALLTAAPLRAHVALDSPNGGESFGPGEAITIQWHVLIQHNTIGWNLEYSTNGDSGPWLPIAMGLPAGDITAGAMHSYVWIAPFVSSGNVRVRVTQDNTASDYTDLSNADFGIGEQLAGDVPSISVSAGGTQTLSLDVGPNLAFSLYIVAGTISGTSPGVLHDGLVVPLNVDFYFQQTLDFPNQHPLGNSLGVLDPGGTATITVTLFPGEIPGVAAGIVCHHAAGILDPGGTLVAVTRPVPLLLAP
ncbi:MAG: hypothetical protein R3F20_02950 [Planctomycetota bacterium]